ncbi:MAG: L,D-transpeptidase family protein [Limnochordales bacterium]|nr:L,D-transpeptidase family protein [Limnochordales bacterium]
MAQTLASLPPDGVVDDEVWLALDRLGKPLLGYDSTSVASQSSTRLPPPPGPIYLYVDLDKATLTVYSEGKPYKTYPVATGKSRTASPLGDWKVVWKDRGWGGGFGTRWMGLNVPWGTYGIHGTNKPWSIGRRASAGCFRMFNRDVEELYEWVPHGTRVIVRGSVSPRMTRSEYAAGASGQDVVWLQIALQRAGVLTQEADGRFGPATQKAVAELQAALRLPVTGRAGSDLLMLLGLR